MDRSFTTWRVGVTFGGAVDGPSRGRSFHDQCIHSILPSHAQPAACCVLSPYGMTRESFGTKPNQTKNDSRAPARTETEPTTAQGQATGTGTGTECGGGVATPTRARAGTKLLLRGVM
jgi:hypothetical protein